MDTSRAGPIQPTVGPRSSKLTARGRQVTPPRRLAAAEVELAGNPVGSGRTGNRSPACSDDLAGVALPSGVVTPIMVMGHDEVAGTTWPVGQNSWSHRPNPFPQQSCWCPTRTESAPAWQAALMDAAAGHTRHGHRLPRVGQFTANQSHNPGREGISHHDDSASC